VGDGLAVELLGHFELSSKPRSGSRPATTRPTSSVWTRTSDPP